MKVIINQNTSRLKVSDRKMKVEIRFQTHIGVWKLFFV